MGVDSRLFIQCQTCGLDTPRRGPGLQKYCVPCSVNADLERKRKWKLKHPTQAPRAIDKARRRELRALRVTRGAEQSRLSAHSIAWPAETGHPDLAWCVRVAVPFSYRFSKNHLWSMAKKGHVFLRADARSARDALAYELKAALRGRQVVQNKLWIDVLAQKPNHRGDAVNLLDSICDAVKMAVPLDDRWYCVRRLDWQIVKIEPRIYVGIGQEDVPAAQVCSICGRLAPLTELTINKAVPSGFARECRECRGFVRRNSN